jgi:hypothetical protein
LLSEPTFAMNPRYCAGNFTEENSRTPKRQLPVLGVTVELLEVRPLGSRTLSTRRRRPPVT